MVKCADLRYLILIRITPVQSIIFIHSRRILHRNSLQVLIFNLRFYFQSIIIDEEIKIGYIHGRSQFPQRRNIEIIHTPVPLHDICPHGELIAFSLYTHYLVPVSIQQSYFRSVQTFNLSGALHRRRLGIQSPDK